MSFLTLRDNQATLGLVKNRQHHSRTKHIQLRNNFIRERQDAGEIICKFIETKRNLADIFTKPLTTPTIETHFPHITGEDLVYSEG